MNSILQKIQSIIDGLKADFDLNFIQKDRWILMVKGLGSTLLITLCAALIGVVIGIIVAAIRTSYDKNLETMKLKGGAGYHILKFFNGIFVRYRKKL